MQQSRRHFVKNIGWLAALPVLPCDQVYAGNSPAAGKHRVLSANIRVALPEDDAKGVGWNDRKETCIQVIRAMNPDIICLQEVLKVQDRDMKAAFTGYGAFGFEGPDMDAFPEGYHGIAKNIILYSRDRYEQVSSGCYWLSATPLIAGSKSWDTARARHCNWLRLRDRTDGREFRILNTHLDHLSQEAREQQVQMIMDESGQYQSAFPQILAGDFNADMTSAAIQKVKLSGWADTYASVHGEIEPGFTVHEFMGDKRKPGRNGRIDFIFAKGPVKPVASEIIKDQIGGKYPSDHYFIFADISW